ncbi:hypothetical protein BW727_102078 [Jeotgalibaca dankookensis]|uniref:Uncharacterized protein n=1 Tax=Jeotgalibaca dankookensis TaxID=708126 RepID=A0A1S6IS73_9LACT|nr:YdiK family protein [Jeotgalibaca dankookensis]AQS54392.1 hypothetical protein BW727_102078 [Jeotgalibaca dankookensis]
MNLKNILIQIIVKLAFAVLFIYFAVDSVNTSGWGFLTWISIFFATNNIATGIQMLIAYFKIKNSLDK